MKLAEAQKVVADDFLKTMKEENFETFEEMRDCYWWTTADIKEEVRAILAINETDCYIDEVDGTDVLNDDEMISYRKFMIGVYKLIREA